MDLEPGTKQSNLKDPHDEWLLRRLTRRVWLLSKFWPRSVVEVMKRRGAALAASALAGGGALLLHHPDAEPARRSCRASVVAARVALDYKSLEFSVDPLSDAYLAARSATHARCAQRLRALCNDHGGLWVKLAQHIAALGGVVPREWRDALAQLQDQREGLPFADVRPVIERELGGQLEDHFESFEERSTAAASIAQVHRAVTRDGTAVAVKVQYPDLPAQLEADLAAMRTISALAGLLFGGDAAGGFRQKFGWVVPEFEQTVLRELDFREEARNGQRARELLRAGRHHPFDGALRTRVVVPRALPALSSKRVLTMEWAANARRVDDVQHIRRMGVEPAVVADCLTRAIARLVFACGFVHLDPHPGNVLVRATEAGDWELVLLDWGMSRELAPAFRADHAALWCGLLAHDAKVTDAAARALDVKPADLFWLSLAFVARPPPGLAGDDGLEAPLGARLSEAARKKVRARALSELGAADAASDFLRRLPRDQLYVMRVMGIARSISTALGGTAPGRLRAYGDAAASAHALAGSDAEHESQWRAFLAATRAVIVLRARVHVANAVALARLRWHGAGARRLFAKDPVAAEMRAAFSPNEAEAREPPASPT